MRNHAPRLPRWAIWISSAVTFLAAAMLIFAIVLGVRAGQEQLTIKRRQQVSMILEQAFLYHNQGKIEAARIAYEEVLILDPDNGAAAEGLGNLRVITLGGIASEIDNGTESEVVPSAADAVAATKPSEPIVNSSNQATPLPVAPTMTPITAPAQATNTTPASNPTLNSTLNPVSNQSTGAAALANARESFAAGRWSQTVDQLVALQVASPNYQQAAVTQLLFDAYVGLARERDNQDKLQEAVVLFDKALALQPDTTTGAERALIADYIDAVTYAGVDWARALRALEAIYQIEPFYRDVEDRLQQALIAQSEQLADAKTWCDAAELLDKSIAIGITTGVIAQRDEYQEACETDGASLAERDVSGDALPEEDDDATPTGNNSTPGTLSGGKILYSAFDGASGRSRIMAQVVGSPAAPTLLRDDAAQPALRQDGVRLLYRNLRSDMAGLSAWDANSGLLLRFTQYAEDTLPSWNAQSNRFVFASNREGDRLWRIYASWAESEGETTTLSIGEAPAWHPTADQIVFRGCDNSGNRCGLWLINGSGGGRAALTTIAADNRPTWSPAGRYVVFMSNGRDGNFELYRVDTSNQQLLRLTTNSAADLLPTVSPDGRSVAFVSNRDGAWKLWGIPLDGGTPTVIAPLSGDLGNWTEHSLQWVP